jgi:uncharacterized protein YdeI (YjbR/CyaY-like superfamily)
MSTAPVSSKPVFFRNAAAFRTWLRRNGTRASSLLVGYYKVGTGKPSITWPESVDEALCVGWIDGIRRRIDDEAYAIRFTPRKKDSTWSAVNIARAKGLIAEGRMRPAGLAAFERRTERRSSIYSYERRGLLKLTLSEVRLLKRDGIAWRNFEGMPPGYRRMILHWIVSAKRPATRARRLAKLVESCSHGRRLFP